MSQLPQALLFVVFLASAVVIWRAGISLSNTTDYLDKHFNLGSALGGLVLLAFATNLPELAITLSASLSGAVEIAVSNIIGGIGIQTLVVVLLDYKTGKKSIISLASSRALLVEGGMVVILLSLILLGSQLPTSAFWFRMSPAGVLIALVWVGGLILVDRSKRTKSLQVPHPATAIKKTRSQPKYSTRKAVFLFGLSAVATLIAGVGLEQSGDLFFTHLGLSGPIFGATVLAAATSLPEVSTGLASVRLSDYRLAVSDIFGGNAFLPVLILLAELVSGKPALPHIEGADVYLTALGLMLTAVYVVGLKRKSEKTHLKLSDYSIGVLALYMIGVVGLFFIT